METVVQTIVAELHQLREEHLELKREVKQQIGNIQEKQQVFGKSVSNLSNELADNFRLCISNVERLENNSEEVEMVSHCHDEINATVLNLQKKIDSHLDITKSSIQTLEASMFFARLSMDQLSHDCATEFKNLESKNNQVHEALSIISTDIEKTVQSLAEKSLTSLSENDELMKPNRRVKEETLDIESIKDTDNKLADLQDESDDEVISKGAEQGKRDSIKSESTQVLDILPGRETLEKSADTTKNSKEKVITAEITDESEKRRTYNMRRKRVYIIIVVSSVPGQVNQAMLGKLTKMFV